ncbi:hypothetical protein [Mycolicibacterium fallax]|uniref:hypothetical protein n=1 Tax=Mycolicibacterium fallax TaxID=1793 RepID=UPI00138D02EE|nr:hypothetical protein [Mycolicibacterium fallax]BBZ00119.1 hypothetical protein MFAL_35850 [Mycolicibacterium fallax]HOW93490.1 hypothetical protein [Mycolicibacterium fallax]
MSYPPQGYGSGGYGGEQSGGYGGQQPGYGGQPWSGAQPGGGQQDPFFPAYGEAPALDSYATPGGPGGPPPGGTSRGLVIGLTAGAVVAVLLVVGAVLWGFGRGGDSSNEAATATTTKAVVTGNPAPSTTEPAFPSTSVDIPKPTGDTCTGTAAPTTPTGWQTVAAKRGLSYDVPPEWQVLSCGTMVGWEKKCPDGPFGTCPIRVMSGASELVSPTCSDSSVAVAGVPGFSDVSDITEAVNAESDNVVDIYTSDDGQVPTVSLSPPKNLTVGGQAAVQVVATVTGIKADECTGPSALHSMVATTVPGQPGTVLFVISMDQGIDGAAGPEVIDQMVASLRSSDAF